MSAIVIAGTPKGAMIYRSDASRERWEVLGFRLGTLDTDSGTQAALHYMVGSKAPWVEIHDALPQDPVGVPFGERD